MFDIILNIIIFGVIVAIVIYIIKAIAEKIQDANKNNVQYYIKQLPEKSIDELQKMQGSLVTTKMLHDKMVEMGNRNADSVSKCESLGCHNYQDIQLLMKAISEELSKRK